MKIQTFLKIKGILFIIFGIILVLLVPKFIHIFGYELNNAGIMLGRWSGAGFIGIGVISLKVSKIKDNEILNTIIDGLFTCDILGLCVTIFSHMRDASDALGWIAILFWLIITIGVGYFRFFRKQA